MHKVFSGASLLIIKLGQFYFKKLNASKNQHLEVFSRFFFTSTAYSNSLAAGLYFITQDFEIMTQIPTRLQHRLHRIAEVTIFFKVYSWFDIANVFACMLTKNTDVKTISLWHQHQQRTRIPSNLAMKQMVHNILQILTPVRRLQFTKWKFYLGGAL